ncbi:hypothetical protein EVAR_77111_1 [Eumeta japonica]|uniref:Uncharacterized protein n=1 Tax=Eumeta variegata TaxID=151549 RepID=A0A4C1T2J6_EUMVA|nr:hypothetical protein EVAR_77111_1 [Eumeta japonica]
MYEDSEYFKGRAAGREGAEKSNLSNGQTTVKVGDSGAGRPGRRAPRGINLVQGRAGRKELKAPDDQIDSRDSKLGRNLRVVTSGFDHLAAESYFSAVFFISDRAARTAAPAGLLPYGTY